MINGIQSTRMQAVCFNLDYLYEEVHVAPYCAFYAEKANMDELREEQRNIGLYELE